MQDKEEWITMSEASVRLNVAASKLSRLVKAGKIQTRKDTVDERVRLVEFNQVRDLLQSSVTYKKQFKSSGTPQSGSLSFRGK